LRAVGARGRLSPAFTIFTLTMSKNTAIAKGNKGKR
jgi:hypothetical protein